MKRHICISLLWHCLGSATRQPTSECNDRKFSIKPASYELEDGESWAVESEARKCLHTITPLLGDWGLVWLLPDSHYDNKTSPWWEFLQISVRLGGTRYGWRFSEDKSINSAFFGNRLVVVYNCPGEYKYNYKSRSCDVVCKCDYGVPVMVPVGEGACDDETTQRCMSMGCNEGYNYNAETQSCDLMTISDYCEFEVPVKKVFVYFAIDVAQKETRMRSMKCAEEIVQKLPLDFVPVLYVFPTRRLISSSDKAIREMYSDRNRTGILEQVRNWTTQLNEDPANIRKNSYWIYGGATSIITAFSKSVAKIFAQDGDYDILLTITPGKILASDVTNRAYKNIPINGHLLFGPDTDATRKLISDPKYIIKHSFYLYDSDRCVGQAEKVRAAVCDILQTLAKKNATEVRRMPPK